MPSLSQATIDCIYTLFAQNQSDQVKTKLMEQCLNQLALVNNTQDYQLLIERIGFAVLKLSQADIDKLDLVLQQTRIDWRDTLVKAGFATDNLAHLKWQASLPSN